MTAVYKRCPFCERVFDIDDDGERLRRHIRVAHTESNGEGREDEDEHGRLRSTAE